MNEDPIEAERLGRIGERFFALQCELAGLVPQKCEVDVTGWDFVVEEPIAKGEFATPLDQRRTRTAHVQLKTTAGSGNRVRLTLSAIGQLASHPQPAFVIVLRTNSKGDVLAGYLVHLIGSELAQILRRLRLAESRKAYGTNRQDISFDYVRAGQRFAPEPEGLRSVIEQAWGEGGSTYIVEKQRQLDELGYEDGRFEAHALIRLDGPEHFNNILLGLAPLRPERLKAFDCRFGIRIPYTGPLFDDVEEFLLTPPTLGSCQILIRPALFAPPATFDAEMFIGPPLDGVEGPELFVRGADLLIRMRQSQLNLESVGRFDEDARPLARWRQFARALSYMKQGGASMTLTGNERIPAMTLPVTGPLTGPYQDELPELCQFLDGWTRLLDFAGFPSGADISFDEIWEAKSARLAVDLAFNPSTRGFIELQAVEADAPDRIEGLYFDNAVLGDAAISYCLKIVFERTGEEPYTHRSASFEPVDARPIVADLSEYGAEQAELHKPNVMIDPRNLTKESWPAAPDALAGPA